jgi:hypothetical protein
MQLVELVKTFQHVSNLHQQLVGHSLHPLKPYPMNHISIVKMRKVVMKMKLFQLLILD